MFVAGTSSDSFAMLAVDKINNCLYIILGNTFICLLLSLLTFSHHNNSGTFIPFFLGELDRLTVSI